MIRHPTLHLLGPVVLALLPASVEAGEADVVAARGACDASSVCRFRVAVRHDDEGWSHYADRWEVLAPDGEVLGTRVLRHPHVGEQPFTRGLRGVEIPHGIRRVRIRAGDSVHGFGGREIEIELRRPRGGGADPPDRREGDEEETPR